MHERLLWRRSDLDNPFFYRSLARPAGKPPPSRSVTQSHHTQETPLTPFALKPMALG
jgi:hypothetical protein